MASELNYCGDIVVVKVNIVFYWKQNTSEPHWSSFGDKKSFVFWVTFYLTTQRTDKITFFTEQRLEGGSSCKEYALKSLYFEFTL